MADSCRSPLVLSGDICPYLLATGWSVAFGAAPRPVNRPLRRSSIRVNNLFAILFHCAEKSAEILEYCGGLGRFGRTMASDRSTAKPTIARSNRVERRPKSPTKPALAMFDSPNISGCMLWTRAMNSFCDQPDPQISVIVPAYGVAHLLG